MARGLSSPALPHSLGMSTLCVAFIDAGEPQFVRRQAAAKKGEEVDEQRLGFMKQMLTDQIDRESDPYFATARVWDDGVIDPRDTRTVLGIALSAAHSGPVRGTTSWGVFRH